ncbi:hypothetical protein [Novosphingobium sp. CECT 9465]|uniref:hypothetical protein n=1 Tax=Novosphingobium sp. CECT 9465 TaxID=2829794 RepID=UPI001E34AF97|nr:hypothetical protein [Novosphingobium sp. CECT 9465]CAH0497447.1 hypothetical protein NVSP9465_02507 [Novosphingobium sp. CECT 9465]
MTRFIFSKVRICAAVLGTATAFWTAPAALAATGGTAATTDALASVVVVEPVGAGFAFDIINDAVSAVFLNGDAGDSVSLLMSRRRSEPRNGQRNPGGVVVMTSGVYRIDLLTPVNGGLRASRGTSAGAGWSGGSSILFLAQFN